MAQFSTTTGTTLRDFAIEGGYDFTRLNIGNIFLRYFLRSATVISSSANFSSLGNILI